MPEPEGNEEQQEFISRCIEQLVGEEGYEQEQAAAICYAKWEKGEKALPVVMDMLPDAVKAPPPGHEFYGNQYGGSGGGESGGDGGGGGGEQGSNGNGRHSGLSGEYALTHSSFNNIQDDLKIMGSDKTMGDYKNAISQSADVVLERVYQNKENLAIAARDDPDGFSVSIDSSFRREMNNNFGSNYGNLNYFSQRNGQTVLIGITQRSLDEVVNIIKYQAEVIIGTKSLKIGARNSSKDQERLQQIHDFSVENGAVCAPAPEVVTMPLEVEKAVIVEPAADPEEIPVIALKSSDPKDDEVIIAYGGELKALGEGRIGGYGISFTPEGEYDLTSERFAPDTYYGSHNGDGADVMLHHGFPMGKEEIFQKMANHALKPATTKIDELGIFAETVCNLADEYDAMVYDLVGKGKFRWSSATAGHTSRKKPEGKGWKITRWPIVEFSLTPSPAEPRNTVIPLKSLLGDNTATQTATDEAEAVPTAQSASADAEPINNPTKEQEEMELDESKLQELMAGAAAEAVKAYRETEPPLKTAAANIEVVRDEADRPFKSIAEQCIAIKAFELSHGRREDSRLKRLDLKGVATGANENVQSEGGYLLDPTLSATLMKPIHEEGPFTSQVTRLPVSNNSNYGWINGVDETSRADGSRWGGIRGYWAAEAATVTASKPAFRRINWELNKLFILAYGTDELLADAAQFEAVLQQGAREEMAFKVNNGVLNGTGAGQPLGVLNSGALISITAETNQVATTVLYENLIKMWARLPSASKPKANWYINTDVNPQLDQLSLASGTAALEPRFIGYDQNGVMRIKGRPVIETEFNATLGTVGDIVLMDPTAYLMWEKTGVESATSIHVQFIYDETTFRFTYRCDGQPSISSALTPFMGTNTLSPFIVLATRS